MRVLSGRRTSEWLPRQGFIGTVDRNNRSKSDYFCPVPGKPVRQINNSKFSLASPKIFPYSISSSRGRSSAGRALDWQSRGQGFDPPRLHHVNPKGHRIAGGLFSYQSTPQKVAQIPASFVHSLLAKHNAMSNSRRQPYNSGSAH